MQKFVGRFLGAVAVVVTLLAFYDQFARAPEHRTWTGHVFFIPYDFRVPTFERLRSAIWNVDRHRPFSPQVWGVGWTFNLAFITFVGKTLLDQATRVRRSQSETGSITWSR